MGIIFKFCLIKTSDVPDSLSGSGRILPFLSDIRIRPDLDMKKNQDPAGSLLGSGRIRIFFSYQDPVGS